MKQFIIAVAILGAASMSALGQNNQGPNQGGNGGNHHAAPGPIVGAGPVGLVVGGIGFGVYWLVKRRRRKPTEA
jgi:hypothetical protein